MLAIPSATPGEWPSPALQKKTIPPIPEPAPRSGHTLPPIPGHLGKLHSAPGNPK